jgi:4-amino-4-deoxy-L-arabinose transferase-like glycosyltransferase
MADPAPTGSRVRSFSARDALTAACLFLGLAALFAFTRSHWLDDWDSVNFAFGLDDFDVTKHWPHPPGYPVYIAAGKLVYRVIADHAGALTLVSALSGAAVASMFYLLERRNSDWPVALCATLIMALSPLFWLQSGLALTDMFGMVFVVAFLLVEGTTTTTPRGAFARRIACGLIAGLSVGARPHMTLLIVLYWCFRAHRPFAERHVVTAVLAFAVGIAAWLIPACSATGGPQIYWTATVGQFEWRLDRPGVSVLGAPITGDYLLARILMLIGSIGQAFGPMHLTEEHIARRGALGLLIIVPYVFFAWRGASKKVARPYLIASAIYLLMLFILLPVRHLRYFLPLSLIVGWSVSGYLALFRRPAVRALALAALAAFVVLPSFFLIGGLSKVPPPVAGLDWVKANRPDAILYSGSLRRHAEFYWPEGKTVAEPKTEADCIEFRKVLESGRPVLSTNSPLCGINGTELVEFKRDARIHDKHHIIPIFAYGKSALSPG